MGNLYKYFDRDISWLSFNYRVLLEAEDATLPLYERIKFMAIHASNLEEFYKIRVSYHRGIILKKRHSDEDPEGAEKILEKIKTEVTRQQNEFLRIYHQSIVPELEQNHIFLYQNQYVRDCHLSDIRQYFNEEIFPFLEPVMILKEDIRFFIRDNRIYIVVRLLKKNNGKVYYAILKIPYTKVPRFIELPVYDGLHYYIFIDDIIKANLSSVFPGFEIESSYCIKISRDADIYIDDEENNAGNLAEKIIKKIKQRKIGDLSRFVYDGEMPADFLEYIADAFDIKPEDLIPEGNHLNMQDLVKLPNPVGKKLISPKFKSLPVPSLENADKIIPLLKVRDVFLFYPYHSFDSFLRLLSEAAINPDVISIATTQYRVAENSDVINTLIFAAQNGKEVVVFVELKARFDEENNFYTAERMKQAGIKIIYSLTALKVHAKVALISEKRTDPLVEERRIAYLSTGNFNEKTAELYSDISILTADARLTREIALLFGVLKGEIRNPVFEHILVAQYNMVERLKIMIQREAIHARQNKKAKIVLKMNGLQDKAMIDELYRASEAGVEIELIVRGICCLVPEQPYSRNIKIIRIVDAFLEHARVWYFYNEGKEDVYIGSADWMKRNLYRRIEAAFPVLDPDIKQQIIDILTIQLSDNVKACVIDSRLNNIFIEQHGDRFIRSQKEIYEYLKRKE